MSPLHRRTSFPSGRRVAPRRKLVWATTNQVFTLTAGGRTSVDLGAAFEVAGASLLGVTIARTHLSCYISNWAAVGNSAVMGLYAEARQADVGAQAGPTPGSDPELDWMLLRAIYPGATGATVNAATETVVDVRAKRKMEEMGQRYIFAISSAQALTVNVYARVLFMLP